MGYRDEREALRSRLEVTEQRVAELEEENERLRKASAKRDGPTRARDGKARKPGFRLGRLHFSRPRTYFPLLHLLVRTLRPSPPPKLETDIVVAWALHRFVLIPLWYLVVYPLHLVLFPNLAIGLLAATPFYAFALLLRGLRFGESKTDAPWGWDGRPDMPSTFFTITAGGAYGFATVSALVAVWESIAP